MGSRGRKRTTTSSSLTISKRRKVDPNAIDHVVVELQNRHSAGLSSRGTILMVGSGDTGQLGLGPDIMERSKPAKLSAASLSAAKLDVESMETFVQVVAGGMHTVALTADGRVFTFGCNDESALGRNSTDAEIDSYDEYDGPVEESRPGVVKFPAEEVRIKMISAGDSHTAALDSEGRVWLWGTFRGASGVIGLTKEKEICREPVLLTALTETSTKIIKIASGQDHLVCLTDDGRLFTLGCAEQGQLGRVAERFAKDGGRNGVDHLLNPGECRLRKRFIDVWAGGYATLARCLTTGIIYACGLNNYGQLALVKQSEAMEVDAQAKPPQPAATADGAAPEKPHVSESSLAKKQGPLVQFMLTPANGFDPDLDWSQFAIGMHHTLALTASGTIYAVGRSDYGRLGLSIPKSGVDNSSIIKPGLIGGVLEGRRCKWVGCGEACSFAVDDQGKAFSWGIGSSQQLAQEEEDEDSFEPGPMVGKNVSARRMVMVDAGGQHTVMLASETPKDELEESNSAAVPATHVTHSPAPQNEKTKKKKEEEVEHKAPETNATNNSDAIPEASTPMDTTQNGETEKPVAEKPALVESINGSTSISAPSLPEVASTAGATVNSSSLHSCSLVASDQSSLSSAHSTDGGGSSRLGGSVFAQPVSQKQLAAVAPTCSGSTASTSEPGVTFTDGGSMTASPSDTH